MFDDFAKYEAVPDAYKVRRCRLILNLCSSR